MDKRILKEIAKRHCKGVLGATDGFAFEDSCLDENEIDYVLKEIAKIANRITSLPVNHSTTDLVNEYYE